MQSLHHGQRHPQDNTWLQDLLVWLALSLFLSATLVLMWRIATAA